MRLLEYKFDKSIQISGESFQFFLSCVALPLSMLSTTHYEFDKFLMLNIDTFVNVEQVVSGNWMDFLRGDVYVCGYFLDSCCVYVNCDRVQLTFMNFTVELLSCLVQITYDPQSRG